jgi:tetratricopeptide (TPR) repeat protein
MAVAYKQVGNVQASLDAYNQALSIAPEDENTLKPFLTLLEEQGRDQEYNELAKKLIEIDPADISYYLHYISFLMKKAMYNEAGKWLARAKSLPRTQIDESRLKSYELKIKAAANNLTAE